MYNTYYVCVCVCVCVYIYHAWIVGVTSQKYFFFFNIPTAVGCTIRTLFYLATVASFLEIFLLWYSDIYKDNYSRIEWNNKWVQALLVSTRIGLLIGLFFQVKGTLHL